MLKADWEIERVLVGRGSIAKWINNQFKFVDIKPIEHTHTPWRHQSSDVVRLTLFGSSSIDDAGEIGSFLTNWTVSFNVRDVIRRDGKSYINKPSGNIDAPASSAAARK